MRNQKKILGTTKRKPVNELLRFAKFWNSKPTVGEFAVYSTGMIVRPQYFYWMAKYPNHDIPLGELK